MNSKNMMLTFRDEDFDSQEEEEKGPSQMSQAVKNGPDRYESSLIQRGFFQESQEEPDYLLVHTQPKKREKKPLSSSVKQEREAAQQQYPEQKASINIQEQIKDTGQCKTGPKIAKFLESLEYNFSSSSQEEVDVEREGTQSVVLNPTIYNLPTFLLMSLPQNQRLETLLIRNQFALNAIWPEFKIVSKDCQTHLMIGKKKAISTTSNFYITSYIEPVDADHPEHMGKLRGNFLGNIYNVFLKGKKPKECHLFRRCIIATIRFKSLLSSKTPRQLEVFTLKDNVYYWNLKGVDQNEPNLHQLYQQNNEAINHFTSRLPQFSHTNNSFVLNFGGRIHRPSAKNFILQDPITNREVLMMGKDGDDVFRMDISSPLVPFVAFCVGLAHCDSKFITD